MFFPYKLRVPSERLPLFTVALIVLNIAAYFGTSNGLEVSDWAVQQFALTGSDPSLFRMLSSSFLHGDPIHLVGNMWFLWLYGRPTEGRLGHLRYLLVYFLGDLAGSGLHLLLTASQPEVPSLGASGAVMSLMGAAAWLFPFSRVAVFYWMSYFWMGTWEARVWAVASIYFALDVLGGVLGDVGVANFAHVGGAVGGLLVALALRGRRDSAGAGEALSVLDEVQDYRGLTRSDLAQIQKGKPGDIGSLLALLRHDLGQGRPLDPGAVSSFTAAFPRIEQTVPVHDYADLVESLGVHNALPARVHIMTGRALERENHFRDAETAYRRAMGAPGVADPELEFAHFKLAQIMERFPASRAQATQMYADHARKWPMSELNGQVRAKISALSDH